jgi:hypothetical protein
MGWIWVAMEIKTEDTVVNGGVSVELQGGVLGLGNRVTE